MTLFLLDGDRRGGEICHFAHKADQIALLLEAGPSRSGLAAKGETKESKKRQSFHM